MLGGVDGVPMLESVLLFVNDGDWKGQGLKATLMGVFTFAKSKRGTAFSSFRES